MNPDANMCCSRQIRPPIYSLKQSKLRRRRVIRYAILYFTMFILFMALIIGPVVVKKFINLDLSIPMQLMQPTHQNNNDTSDAQTGRFLNGAAQAAGGGAAATGGSRAGTAAGNAGGGAPAGTTAGGGGAAATTGFSF